LPALLLNLLLVTTNRVQPKLRKLHSVT